jgi:hypothetical protein
MQWPTGGPIAEQVWQLDQRRKDPEPTGGGPGFLSLCSR